MLELIDVPLLNATYCGPFHISERLPADRQHVYPAMAAKMKYVLSIKKKN